MRRRRARRHAEILELLTKENSLRIEDLHARFGVSEVTLRMDLAELESQGALIRTHGGAVKAQETIEVPYVQRSLTHRDKKQLIGRAAADLVQDGEIILLDSGSTTLEVAKHLATRPAITVITNDLYIGIEFSRQHHPQAHMIGGMLNTLLECLIGPETERALGEIRVDKLFLGTHAIANEHLMERSPLMAQTKRAMIRTAKEVILVADSSKFGQTGLSMVCELSYVHRIVTDKNLDPAWVEAIRNRQAMILV